MPDMTLSVIATRPELDGVDLELNDHVAFSVVRFGPGARARRNTYNTSGNVHGAVLNNSVLDMMIRPLSVRVLATTQAQLDARTATLIETFEQSSFHLAEIKNGEGTVYDCMTTPQISPADPSGGNSDFWDPNQLFAFQHVYTIQVPTQPITIAGPI